MLRDPEYLVDILDAARLAISYSADKDKSAFFADIQCQDAVIRRLEIIGEAARRMSAETKALLPQIPWSLMIGTRNILIHQYDDIDVQIIWEALQSDLPPLIHMLEQHLAPLPE